MCRNAFPGTSAGSIVGAVVAAAAQTGAMTGAQVKELALQLDYRKFLDPGPVERVPLRRTVAGAASWVGDLPGRLRPRMGP